MLINRHDCIELLCKFNDSDNLLNYLILNPDITINKDIYIYLKEKNVSLPVIEHYLLLNNKAHKIIKEILNCEGKDVATYIKIATSLITQATITLEHKFKDNNVEANKFIENTMLSELSQALYVYFNKGQYTELVNVINKIKQDIKLIIN